MLTMAGITANAGLDLGIPDDVRGRCRSPTWWSSSRTTTPTGSSEDTEASLGPSSAELGALDVYVLPAQAGRQLIAAREQAFCVAKAAGADDIVDVVVPRAAIPAYLADVGRLAADHGALVAGCGHVGDGNVHLSVFQPDAERRVAAPRTPSSPPAVGHGGARLRGARHRHGQAGRTSSSSRTRSSSTSCAGSRPPSTPHGILNPGQRPRPTRAPEASTP